MIYIKLFFIHFFFITYNIYYILYIYFYLHKIPKFDEITLNFAYLLDASWKTEIYSTIGKYINVKFNGKYYKCLNTGSYNYLALEEDIKNYIKNNYDLNDINYIKPNLEEKIKCQNEISKFLKTEDTKIFSTGYGGNVFSIVSIFENAVIFSDEKNHASILQGIKLLNNSKIIVFKHNDMQDLEKKINENKLKYENKWIIAEGLYSMEGNLCNLPHIYFLKKKYNIKIYLDESHSFGTLGINGYGSFEHYMIDSSEIDIIYGSFSKTFQTFGGFISGKKELINKIKNENNMPLLSILSIKFVLNLLNTYSGKLILNKHRQLCEDAYDLFSEHFNISSYRGSPILIIEIGSFFYASILYDYCIKNGLAIVIVGYPVAKKKTDGIIRLCINNNLKKEDLIFIKDLLLMKSNKKSLSNIIEYDNNNNKNKEISLEESIDEFGLGLCGPRGFYGNLSFYSNIENLISIFFKKKNSIICPCKTNGIISIIQYIMGDFNNFYFDNNFVYIDELKKAAYALKKEIICINKYKNEKNSIYFTSYNNSSENKLNIEKCICIKNNNWEDNYITEEYEYIIGDLPQMGCFFSTNKEFVPLKIKNFTYSASLPNYCFIEIYNKLIKYKNKSIIDCDNSYNFISYYKNFIIIFFLLFTCFLMYT